MKILTYIAAALLLVLGTSDFARAQNCSAYPYTLTNGQTADANQVMSNFNTIRSCGNNNLLGKNNNLSDLQSPATARTNLGLGAAAVEGLSNTSAGAVVDDGAGNLVTIPPVLRSQVFTGGGTFVIPATATSATAFRFTAAGGGGGGGSSSAYGGGGGAGGYGSGLFTGFTAGASVTISVGTGGAGVTGNAVGGTGGTTTVSYAATTIVSATGGAGGAQVVGGAAGAVTVAVGGSGLTLSASQLYGAQPGDDGRAGQGPGNGGGCPICGGAKGPASGGGNGVNGVQGGGGSGQGSSGGSNTSGSGGNGAVIVEWVL